MMLDKLQGMNRRVFDDLGDPETQTRIAQYEMAFRMQSSVPELVDTSNEPQHIEDMYGPDVDTPGTFGYNILKYSIPTRDLNATILHQTGIDHETFVVNH